MALKISIVIPAKDEAKRLPVLLESISRFIKQSPNQYEIIVVDDGSTDQTVKVAKAFKGSLTQLRVISLDRNHGKGYAVKQGVLASEGEIILFLDADGATQPNEIDRHIGLFSNGFDIVIGSRVVSDADSKVKTKFYRKLMGSIFNFLVSTLLIKGIKDTQCGFKMFKSRAAKTIFEKIKLEGFGFDLEVLYLAQKNQFKIKEVPVNWVHIPGSKVDLIKDSLRMFLNILEIKKIHKY